MDRIKDPALMKIYAGKRCLVCGSTNSVSGHHLKSRGSWGPDVPQNLVPLCFKHHTEVHKSGLVSFAEKFAVIKLFLQTNNWTMCPLRQRWVNSSLEDQPLNTGENHE
jgi:predicted restriction endonuclease